MTVERPQQPSFAFAKRHGAALREWTPDSALIAHRTNATQEAFAELRRHCGVPLRLEHHSDQAYDAILHDLYGDNDDARSIAIDLDQSGSDGLSDLAFEPEDLLESEDDAPIIRLLNALLTEAIKQRASDIHIEPFESRLAVRFRVDGVLREVLSQNKSISSAIVSRIKVMARLDIAEKRLPQDGRISLRVAGRPVDVRVGTTPVGIDGERVVLRLLDKQTGRLEFSALGLPQEMREQIDALIQRPHGILLVTGPTGSGKTTTLYAAIQRLNDASRNILTVEDPIEYYLDGIGQTQINQRIGMGFAHGLRALLRQDPDVVMIGEIRDLETAQIAVQASLTGHLVLSTLHTNSAIGAITRLRDMGVEPFLLSASLIGVLSQRLVRTIEKNQSEAYLPTPAECAMFGKDWNESIRFQRPPPGSGHSTGYRGRTGLYELVLVDDELRKLIHEVATESDMTAHARTRSRSLMDDGWDKLCSGITSTEEVLRVIRED